MSRFVAYLKEIRKKNPDDWWAQSFEKHFEEEPTISEKADVYSAAIEQLDEKSWGVLQTKAETSFLKDRKNRGKAPFFDLINEALAYDYLRLSGAAQISVLPDNWRQGRSPDISFKENEQQWYCEVKTISNSDEEISRRGVGGTFDSSVYSSLPNGFFEKLRSVIEDANDQLECAGTNRMIYLIIHFDDFMLIFMDTYEQQIGAFLQNNYSNTKIACRVGILGRKHICNG